jgi:hypothetical protein
LNVHIYPANHSSEHRVSSAKFSACFPFLKNGSMLMRSPCCLRDCVSVFLHVSASDCPNQSLWNLVYTYIYITTNSSHLNIYFINTSHQSVVLYVRPLSLLGNCSVNTFQLKEFRKQYKNCWTHHFLCGPCRIKGESVGVCVPLSLLGNGFQRRRKIFGSVVFCAVHVVSKEKRRLVLPRTSPLMCTLLCGFVIIKSEQPQSKSCCILISGQLKKNCFIMKQHGHSRRKTRTELKSEEVKYVRTVKGCTNSHLLRNEQVGNGLRSFPLYEKSYRI